MPLPEGWGFCSACEMLAAQAELDREPSERGLDDYPSEWQEQFRQFSQLLFGLSLRYGASAIFRIFDPRSFQGLLKAIRHNVHHYPAFIVEGSLKFAGADLGPLQKALENAGAMVEADTTIV